MSHQHPLPPPPNVPEEWLDTERASHRRRGWHGAPFFLDDNWWNDEREEYQYPGEGEWMRHWPLTVEDILSYYHGQQAAHDRYTFIQLKGTDLYLYLPYQGAVVKVEKAQQSEWDLTIWYPVEEDRIGDSWDDGRTSPNETYLFACEVYLSEDPAPTTHAAVFHPHEEDISSEVTDFAGRNFVSAVIDVVQGGNPRNGQRNPNYRVKYSY